MAAAVTIVLTGSMHLFFLAPVLPQVLPGLGVAEADLVEVAGLVIFVSSAAAAVGGFGAPHLVRLASERRMVSGLLVASSALLAGLGAMRSAGSYTALRFLQVLCIAPVFPLVVARVAHHAGGDVIGMVNSARIGASFVGPVLATSLLAWGSPALVYGVLAALGVACVPLLGVRGPGRGARGTP